MSKKITVLTLFPEMFPGPLGASLPGKALDNGLWNLECINIRDFSHLKHQKVDDKPFGGGHGLVMRADIVDAALQHAITNNTGHHLIHFSPRGKTLKQQDIECFLDEKPITLLCGHYEGIDQRVIDDYIENHNMQEISIGDYILSGGEMAAFVFLDVLLRKIFLKNQETLKEESFEIELLEYPQYTLPRGYKHFNVPEVLLSGNHGLIQKWRHAQSVAITQEKRPDLWDLYRKKEGKI